jgi:hypothetical protein
VLGLFAPAVAFVAGVGVEGGPIRASALGEGAREMIYRAAFGLSDQAVEAGRGEGWLHDVSIALFFPAAVTRHTAEQ